MVQSFVPNENPRGSKDFHDRAGMRSRLAELRHVALDMDGTIYKGSTLFETTLPFLKVLKELGIGYTFLTNNPSKSLTDYLAHLGKFGISATAEQLYTSTQATIEYLKVEWPKVERIFALTAPGTAQELAAAGFTLMEESADAEPDAVVVGFDTTLTYARLCRAAWWISRSKPYFGTNPDQVCPTDERTILVDCGSICAALQVATGKAPAAVLGKPDPAMIRGILQRHGLQAAQVAMVGDRLYTDMEMARRAGAFGVLVLTGETTASEAAKQSPPPDLVVSDLEEFGARLRPAHLSSVKA
jgi:HAD superfamily hydrolase (TIGR01450 family)